MKQINPTVLVVLGVVGIGAFLLIPTLRRAIGISDSGATANGVFLIQVAAGFAGLVAVVVGTRGLVAARRGR